MIRDRLIEWYRARRRDLPWRKTRDPYAVWISEVMLQQTRVDTVIPYYERFLQRWPTVQALADAPPEAIRAAWSGLGYYRRAALMLKAAHAIAKDHGGKLPGDLPSLAALPGFGRYTAGAVASIAFKIEAPAVDGNVIRVLSRLHGIEGDTSKGAANEAVWRAATVLAQGPHVDELNQALIELGALVCTPKPNCVACPVATECVANRTQRQQELPPPRQRAKRKAVELTALLWIGDDSIYLEQQSSEGLFANLWLLPLLEGHLDESSVADEAARKYGWQVGSVRIGATIKHVLTHRDLLIQVAEVHQAPRHPALILTPLAQLEARGIPSVTVKVLRAALSPKALRGAALPGRRTPPKQLQLMPDS